MVSECRPSAAVLAPNAQLEAQLVVQVVEEVAVLPDASAAQLVVQEVEEVVPLYCFVVVPHASAAVFASSSVFP